MARLMEGVRGATSPEAIAGFAKGTVTVFGALADFALPRRQEAGRNPGK